jgi:hypothetical protein
MGKKIKFKMMILQSILGSVSISLWANPPHLVQYYLSKFDYRQGKLVYWIPFSGTEQPSVVMYEKGNEQLWN